MKVVNITKVYHNKHNIVEALKEVSLNFEKCGMNFIVGPSGSGKTTLLNIMASKEKKYIGTIENDYYVEFIEQDFILFEAMTVLDNLVIVNKNLEKIDYFLRKFNLFEQKNLLVKNLSNGQKKRIQIIRSLLVEPQILLCDEPTASLDHDNKEIIMGLLKELSKDICVIIVTHEIDLADKYANRIIQIDNGEIIKDEIIEDKKPLKLERKFSYSKCKYFSVIKKDLFSRKFFSFLNIFLLLVVLICIYTSITVFFAAKSQVKNNFDYYYGKNIILSTPIDDLLIDGYLTSFDTFTYDKIENIIDQVPEILAYNYGFNNDLYSYVKKGGKKFPSANSEDIVDENGEVLYSTYYNPAMPYVFINNDRETRVIPYQINNSNIDLEIGNYPSKNNEAVISYDLAIFLSKELHTKNIKELMGKEFLITIPTDYYLLDLNESTQSEPEKKLKITGVLPYSNRYEYQIFMKKGAYDKFFVKSYKAEASMWNFDYVAFMIDPDAKIETVMQKVNTLYQGELSNFKQKNFIDFATWNIKGAGASVVNEQEFNISLLTKISIFIVITVMFIYVMSQYFNNERNNKESYILQRYGYLALKYRLLKDAVYLFIAMILFIILVKPFTLIMNNMVNLIFNGSMIVELFIVNIAAILFSFLIFVIFIVIKEVLFYVFSFKKY